MLKNINKPNVKSVNKSIALLVIVYYLVYKNKTYLQLLRVKINKKPKGVIPFITLYFQEQDIGQTTKPYMMTAEYKYILTEIRTLKSL